MGADEQNRLKELLPQFRDKPGGLIPALQMVQTLFGYVPESAVQMVHQELGIPLSTVYGVLTFYSFFSTQPRGKHTIRVCMGTACYVRGAKEVLDSLKTELKIDVGETSKDRQFTLEVGRCFGACGLAPAIMIDDDVHQRVKPAEINQILDKYRTTAAVEPALEIAS